MVLVCAFFTESTIKTPQTITQRIFSYGCYYCRSIEHASNNFRAHCWSNAYFLDKKTDTFRLHKPDAMTNGYCPCWIWFHIRIIWSWNSKQLSVELIFRFSNCLSISKCFSVIALYQIQPLNLYIQPREYIWFIDWFIKAMIWELALALSV